MRFFLVALLLLAVIIAVQGGGKKWKKSKKSCKTSSEKDTSSSSHKGTSSSSHKGTSSSSHKGTSSSSHKHTSSSSHGGHHTSSTSHGHGHHSSSGSSSSGSYSHSDVYGYHHYHHFHPRCCDPCKMLKHQHSNYYKRCGKYLNDAEVMQNQKYCMAAKGDKKKLMEVMESFRTQCYTNFAVIIDFDCPPRPDISADKCDEETFEDWQSVCHAGYCPPEPAECDECRALVDVKSHFYKVCGHGISARLLKVWYQSCQSAHDWCRWKTLRAMIIGHCHHFNPDVIPNFCTTSALCGDDPAQDENAIEACSWVIDTTSIYHDCMSKFDVDRVKQFYLMCVEIYCTKGKDGVCEFAENLAEICDEKFYIEVDGTIDMCEIKTTPAPTTPPSDDCDYTGGTLPFGSEDVLLSECTKLCNCTTARMIECRPVQCDEHAICLTDDENNQKCNCTDEYEGDGYTCFPPPIEECLGQQVDLVFVVDTSFSISPDDFVKMTSFVEEVIIRTDIGENKTRVGIVAFSNDAEVVTYLGELNDKGLLVARAKTIIHRKQLTQTDDGIVLADDMFTTYARGETKKVMIIVTDGQSTDQAATVLAMQSFRANHVNATVLAVGVLNSGSVDMGELRELASGLYDANVLGVDDFDALLLAVDTLANETCSDVTDTIPDFEIDTDNNNNPVPVPKDCLQIVYHDLSASRWFSFYGVYDIILGQGLCNGQFVYVHTGYRYYLQFNGLTWVVSSKPCIFDDRAQPNAGLVYGGSPTGMTYVISETGDSWEEPPDRTPPQTPDYTDSVTQCY